MVTFLLPETVRRKRTPVDEKHAAERFKALKSMKAAFCPMIIMLGDPTVLLITLYNTVILACFYFLVSCLEHNYLFLY